MRALFLGALLGLTACATPPPPVPEPTGNDDPGAAESVKHITPYEPRGPAYMAPPEDPPEREVVRERPPPATGIVIEKVEPEAQGAIVTLPPETVADAPAAVKVSPAPEPTPPEGDRSPQALRRSLEVEARQLLTALGGRITGQLGCTVGGRQAVCFHGLATTVEGKPGHLVLGAQTDTGTWKVRCEWTQGTRRPPKACEGLLEMDVWP